MRETIVGILITLAAITAIYLGGYERGVYVTKMEAQQNNIAQSNQNAIVIAGLQAEHETELQKIADERDALATQIDNLHHPECTSFNPDFGMLYNQSITGTKSAPLKSTIPFSRGVTVINRNAMEWRKLLSEYTICYQWAESLR